MRKKILALCLGFVTVFVLGVSIFSAPRQVAVFAEEPETSETTSSEETSEDVTPALTGYVTIAETKNGKLTVDKKEGNVGDVITIQAKHDLFYLVESVSVNGIALVESEETSGLFTFVLAEGENLLTASFAIDQELLGSLTVIYEQAKNKDWAALFSVENILTIVMWVLEGGILIALVRYYVKDKRLEKKLENKVETTINEIIPETTKNTVVDTVKTVVTPIFTELGSEMATITKAMSTFAECLALSQENTPESRLAIIQNLKNLNLGDATTIEGTKKYIEDLVSRSEKAYKETLEAIEKISEKNKNILKER